MELQQHNSPALKTPLIKTLTEHIRHAQQIQKQPRTGTTQQPVNQIATTIVHTQATVTTKQTLGTARTSMGTAMATVMAPNKGL